MTKAKPKVKPAAKRESLAELRKSWMKDPEFVREFDALEDEFAMAAVFINARVKSGLTQEQLAERMGARQSYVARLESGRTLPSVRTLQKFAAATGTKLKVQFEAA